jgi:hypothetical protein
MTLPVVIRTRAVRMLAAAVLTACALTAAISSPPARAGAAQALDISATVRLIPGGGVTLTQRGTFSGAPLGRGSVRLRTRLGQGDGAVFRFVLSTRRGSVSGSGTIALDFRGATVKYRGSADITGGDGAFRALRARGIRVAGHGPANAKAFSFRMVGRATS